MTPSSRPGAPTPDEGPGHPNGAALLLVLGVVLLIVALSVASAF